MVISRDRANVPDRAGDNPAPVHAPEPAPHASPAGAPTVLDPAILDPYAIFAAIGEIPYEWRIDSDVLAWAPNVHAVLAPLDPAGLASGRSYARLMDPQGGSSRSDAILRS